MRFRTIGVELLRSDELGGCAVKSLTVGVRLIGRRNRRKEIGGPDAHATNRIAEQRRDELPNLLWRGAFQHVERTNPDHGIGIGEARFGDADVGRRKVRREFRHVSELLCGT